MAPKFKKDCPICHKSRILYLSDHLRQVHQLSSEERRPWLKSAVFSVEKSTGLPYMSPYPFWDMLPYSLGNAPQPPPVRQSLTTEQKQRQVTKLQTTACLETTPYPDFKFNHMFSMLVVGPTHCSLKGDMGMQVSFCYCKICFREENSTRIFAETLST